LGLFLKARLIKLTSIGNISQENYDFPVRMIVIRDCFSEKWSIAQTLDHSRLFFGKEFFLKCFGDNFFACQKSAVRLLLKTGTRKTHTLVYIDLRCSMKSTLTS